MNRVKAKFQCTAVTDFGQQKEVKMSAVYGNEGENADFTKATPFGEHRMNIDKGTPAADFFEPQKEYYLYFEAAE